MSIIKGKAVQPFLEKVSDLSHSLCGDEFAKEMAILRAERERLLRQSWKEVQPEGFIQNNSDEVFREIDFDTIIANTLEKLGPPERPRFLYTAAEIAITHGELEKAKRLLRMVNARLKRSKNKLLIAKSHQRLGDVAFYRSNWRSTESSYKKSMKIYGELKHKDGMTSTKNALGAAMVEQGKTLHGESLLKQAKTLALSEKLTEILVKIDINLGNVFNIRGEWDEAMACYDEALVALGTSDEDIDLKAKIFHDKAIVHKEKGQLTKALTLLKKSIKFSARSNNMYIKGISYLEEAEVSIRKGDYATGTALATTAFKIFSEIGDKLSVAEVYKVFGIINREKRSYGQANSYFQNSIKINEDFGNKRNLGETLIEVAQMNLENGEKKKAKKNLRSAISCFRQIQATAKMREAEDTLASIAF